MTDTPDRPHPAPRPTPLVSVAVAFYNERDYVGRCMDSLLAQDFGSFEVVCVDDGSTDGTAELLDSYAADPRVTVLHKENGGLADTRNFGVRHARGALVSFVDGDDFVAPNYLSSLYGALSSTGAELAMCRCLGVTPKELGSFEWPAEDGAPRVETMGRAGAVPENLGNSGYFSAWGKLAPRGLYLDHPFPEDKAHEDIFMFRWHFLSLGRFALVDAQLYAYVQRTGSITKSAPTEEKVLCHAEALCALESDLADFPEVAGPVADRCIAKERCWLYGDASSVSPRTDRVREVMAASRAPACRAWPALRRDPEIGIEKKIWFLRAVWAPPSADGPDGAPPGEGEVLRYAGELAALESDLADLPEAEGPEAAFRIAMERCWLHERASQVRPRTDRVREVMADSSARIRGMWPALRRDPEITLTHKAHLWVVARAPFAHVPLLHAWERVKRAGGR